MIHTSLHWIDATILAVSILIAVIVGIYFSKKQKSTDAYFAASGNVPAWAVGMSMFATIISSVTFLAYPGAAYGGNWILLVQGTYGSDNPRRTYRNHCAAVQKGHKAQHIRIF